MQLRDLDATFIGGWHPKDETHDYEGFRRLDSVEGAQGIEFQSPCCVAGKERGERDGRRFARGAHYVICWFKNPRNAPAVPDHVTPGPGRWYFQGDTLDTITFIGPGACSVKLLSGCAWHGFVKNGDAA